MNKTKIIGVIVVLIGLIMVAGSASSGYGAVAPISMSLIVIIGLLLIFSDKVKKWLA